MFGFFKKPKKEPFSGIPVEFRPIMNAAFPRGESQLSDEANSLMQKFEGFFTQEQARGCVVWTKTHSLMNRQLSLAEMCDAVYRHEQGRINREQSLEIYTFILEQDLITRDFSFFNHFTVK